MRLIAMAACSRLDASCDFYNGDVILMAQELHVTVGVLGDYWIWLRDNLPILG
jgi:hypothetical protein